MAKRSKRDKPAPADRPTAGVRTAAQAGAAATLPTPAVAGPPSADRPPGRVSVGRHGPQAAGPPAKYGTVRLRAELDLSADVDIERVCEDAAVEIARLRALVPAHGKPTPWWTDAVKDDRRPGV